MKNLLFLFIFVLLFASCNSNKPPLGELIRDTYIPKSPIELLREQDSVQLSKIKFDSPFHVIYFYNLDKYGIMYKEVKEDGVDSVSFFDKSPIFNTFSIGPEYNYSFQSDIGNASKFNSVNEAKQEYKEYVFYHSDYLLKYEVIK